MTGLFVDGDFAPAADGRTFATLDPATGEAIAEVAQAGPADVDRAVAAARRALDGAWGRTAPSARGVLLWRLADLVEAHAAELAELETRDNGKALAVSAGVDLPLAVDLLRYMAGWATKVEGRTVPLSTPPPGGPWLAYTLREPVGVVAQIIPWNFPLLMATWKLGPALACGCACVLKPAEETPLTALRLAALAAEAGFPPGAVNVVSGPGEVTGAALTAHPGVDKVAFTGSTATGRLVLDAARGNLKRVSLELGGKSPNVVFADADLGAAVPAAALAIFGNSGQGCSAGARLLVERPAFDAVVEGVAAIARGLVLGPGMEEGTDLGPLVSAAQFARVTGYLERGRADGARALAGGGPAARGGWWVEPTVLVDAPPGSAVVREEIFGPVVVAIPFDTEDEAVRLANDTPYGLAAGVWTRDGGRAHRVARRVRAGSVWINAYNVYDAALPFGGMKESGWGREMGADALELYTETKTVCADLGAG